MSPSFVLLIIFVPLVGSAAFGILSMEIREWIDWREKRRARRGGR